VEEGTHAELVVGGGKYASLYASWLGNVRPGELESSEVGSPAP
jgi:hypothetical protein